MNSIDLDRQAVETSQEGAQTVAPPPPAAQEALHSPGTAQPERAFIPIPLDPTRASAKPVAQTPSRRKRIASVLIVLIVIGALALGFLPRWRQRRQALPLKGRGFPWVCAPPREQSPK